MVASGLDFGGKAVHCRTKKENKFVWNGLHKTVKLLFGWLVLYSISISRLQPNSIVTLIQKP